MRDFIEVTTMGGIAVCGFALVVGMLRYVAIAGIY